MKVAVVAAVLFAGVSWWRWRETIMRISSVETTSSMSASREEVCFGRHPVAHQHNARLENSCSSRAALETTDEGDGVAHCAADEKTGAGRAELGSGASPRHAAARRTHARTRRARTGAPRLPRRENLRCWRLQRRWRPAAQQHRVTAASSVGTFRFVRCVHAGACFARMILRRRFGETPARRLVAAAGRLSIKRAYETCAIIIRTAANEEKRQRTTRARSDKQTRRGRRAPSSALRCTRTHCTRCPRDVLSYAVLCLLL